jgi:hypothetical protein
MSTKPKSGLDRAGKRFEVRAGHAALRAGVRPEHADHALVDLAASLKGVLGHKVMKTTKLDDLPDDVIHDHFAETYRGTYPDRVEPKRAPPPQGGINVRKGYENLAGSQDAAIAASLTGTSIPTK